MSVLTWIALVCAAVPAAVFVRNLRLFSAPGPVSGTENVSILIPARDEEANIGAALSAALANARAEVVVLDDGSSDRTYEIAAEIAAREPRLRVIRGEPLPRGWAGKNFACAQLAAVAMHPVLLFVDADVRLAPDAAKRLVSALTETGAQ
ncbi:MAG TPA: glycosyltransferase family 2 protein, partial [Chthoniobacterales bacterium]